MNHQVAHTSCAQRVASTSTSCAPQYNLSRRAEKKAKRKAIKAEKKRQMLEEYMLDNVINENTNTERQISTTTLAYVGGKACRARLAQDINDKNVATFHLG